jgi:integrase
MPCQIKLAPVDTTREPEFYDHGDYERLVTAAAALDPRFLVLVLLAGEAGLRRGEVMGLNLSDVDFVNIRLTVPPHDTVRLLAFRHRISSPRHW